MENKQVHEIFKVVIVGDACVGKTSLANHFVHNSELDTDRSSTIGVDFYSKRINYANRHIKLMIWDTAGQERFRSITKSFYRDSVGALLCFSLLNRKTFENLEVHLKEIYSHSMADTKVVLIGTFSDYQHERTVSKEEAIKFANKYGINYIEASSKTGENVHTAFLTLVDDIIGNINDGKIVPRKIMLSLDDNQNDNQHSSCCRLI